MKTMIKLTSIFFALITSVSVEATIMIHTDESTFKADLNSFTTYSFDPFDGGGGFSSGEVLDKQIPGMTFENAVISRGAFGGSYHSSPNVVLNSNWSTGGAIVIHFDTAVSAVGLWNSSIVDAERFSIFDSSNNLLSSIDLPHGSVNFGGFISSSYDIARVEVVGIAPTNGSIYIDDLTVGTTKVNAPQVHLLIGMGLLALISTGRRGQKRMLRVDSTAI